MPLILSDSSDQTNREVSRPIDSRESHFEKSGLYGELTGKRRPKKKLVIGETSEPISERKYQKLTSKVLSAILYDVMVMGTTSKLRVAEDLEQVRLYWYLAQRLDGEVMVDKAVNIELGIDDLTSEDYIPMESARLKVCVERLGWMVLAVLAQTSSFREFIRTHEDESLWERCLEKLAAHAFNIEILARQRGVDWRGSLAPHSDFEIAGINASLARIDKLAENRPHDIVVDTTSRNVRAPKFEGARQVDIDDYIFNPKNWPAGKLNPASRDVVDHGPCDLCDSAISCGCVVNRFPAQFIQLVDTGAKGVGVYTLMNFRKGEILGEFVGVLHPPDYAGDPVYSLTMQSKLEEVTEELVVSPKRFGNWTRFINHSCSASTAFVSRTIGQRSTMTIEALRDIAVFEELTVDYGSGYWKGSERVCQCGETNCRTKKAEARKAREEEAAAQKEKTEEGSNTTEGTAEPRKKKNRKKRGGDQPSARARANRVQKPKRERRRQKQDTQAIVSELTASGLTQDDQDEDRDHYDKDDDMDDGHYP
ncbi:SET domain-containing protein [Aspergillus heteromorphus CBS 117.55]|uniref:SET domain-containing protein n=1 Tax=Aspergillus heteromorphus CBS 117.55 TaxID=1448321 RepID=A0A317WWY0_9EURO|nr:SET domain-containing protein [Aspergillus heteromorphus CBS 117.55]PWY90916.1 SET domain-containing protein [Aspergillus heteromorphus CBS 117.55]